MIITKRQLLELNPGGVTPCRRLVGKMTGSVNDDSSTHSLFCNEQLFFLPCTIENKQQRLNSLRLSDWSNCLSPKWNAGGLASAEGATLRDEGAARKKVAG
jgi:hypothetical protein